ncbi:hypothetical protein GGF31_001866 [Allomyces arbusculus]|nr:hypothetical protein GGF31_001866 [Allomyces arbusculus]
MYGHGAAGSNPAGPYAGPPYPPAYAHAPGPYYDGWGAPAPPAGCRGSYPDPASTLRYGEVSDRDAWGPRPTTQDACVPSQYAAVLYSGQQYADPRYPASNYASAAYPGSDYVPAAPYPTFDHVRAPIVDARYPPAQYAYPSAYAHDAFPHDAAPRPATADVDYPPVPVVPEAADPIPAVPLPLATPPKATVCTNHDEGEDDDRGSDADVEVTGTAAKRAGSDGDGDGDGGKARRHYTEFTKFTYELMVASLVAGPRGGRWGVARKHTTPIDVVRSALHAALRHPPGADPTTIASAPHDPTGPLRIFTLEEALRLAAATRAPPHELAGISRKKWARLKACLRIVPGRPLYRCLAWVGGGDAILAPREDWDMIVRDAHLHLNEATGMVEHRSLKQTFLAVKEQYQTRRSRSGIGYEACEQFCQACVCYGALDRTAEAGAASTGGGVGADVDAGAVPAD